MPVIHNPTDPTTGQPLEPKAVLGAYANIIGLPLQGFTAHMAVKLAPTFELSGVVAPVFDLSQTLKQNEYALQAVTVTPITGNTTYQLITPPQIDATYLNLSALLGTARAASFRIFDPSGVAAVIIYNQATAVQTHILDRNTLPVFVPANYILELTITSSNAADGNTALNYIRVERPVGMGPFLT